MKPRHLLFALILLLTGLVPVGMNAQEPRMDGPTRAALNELRAASADIAPSLANNKGVTSDQITASYNGQLSLTPQQSNTVMVVRSKAERAAWAQMDPTSRALIKNFFASR